MIRRMLAQLMIGRYGGDQLNMFLIMGYLILSLIFLFAGWVALDLVALALLLAALFRAFSRRLDRRREENARFLQMIRPIQRRFNSLRTRAGDREHRYFKCPNCGQQMRVPKGKGRITVHCRSCGATFEEKS